MNDWKFSEVFRRRLKREPSGDTLADEQALYDNLFAESLEAEDRLRGLMHEARQKDDEATEWFCVRMIDKVRADRLAMRLPGCLPGGRG